MTQTDRTQERLIEVYRKKAKHYDITSTGNPSPRPPATRPYHRTCLNPAKRH